ncbi:proteasome subunit alpha [Gordonia shandongensis]|uniref:proteasome subunit alpha n=1 Tax=Gordonia shandongensis TaxID=376351 RepID=UPI000408F9FB|nr:proteasome subunit alpha [Gordonia shandongensis]
MTFPYYASAEQIMRDRSELARKGIARGRSVIALTYADGVLFVAHNPSNTLRKVSEIYDRIGFAAVGKYNEFEGLRKAGIQMADLRGYSYDRADVTGLSLASAYANTLGAVFTEQAKPFEVELCVAEVAQPGRETASRLYRIGYDGSIVDETSFIVMGGTTEPIVTAMTEAYRPDLDLAAAVRMSAAALAASADTPSSGSTASGGTTSGNAGSGSPAAGEKAAPPALTAADVEVAILDRTRPRRAFRRLTDAAVATHLGQE